jgi:type IV secretion system protein VirD4
MLPQELKELGQWKEIVLLENTKPILCDKIRYYDDPAFISRVMEPPVVPPLDLDLFVAKLQNRIRPLQDSELQADGSDLSDVPPEHLLLMDADIELPPPDDEEGAYEFVTQCYQEQLGVSVSEINALVEKTTPNAESPVPELSQWLLNGLEFMAAVDAGAEVDDVVGAQRLDQVGVERAFLGF